jgi:hypothetical protein
VYTPDDSIVVSGNFMQLETLPMHCAVHGIDVKNGEPGDHLYVRFHFTLLLAKVLANQFFYTPSNSPISV